MSSIGLVIGITIGGGIFRTPAGIATRVPDPVLMLGVWVLGGVDRAVRRAGVRRAVGVDARDRRHVCLPARRLGPARTRFLYGWAQLVLIRAAALGGISSVFGEYFLRVVRHRSGRASRRGPTISLPGAIVFAGVTNIVGVQLGALFAGISTIAKFGALALLVLASFAAGRQRRRLVHELRLDRRAGRCRASSASR